MSTIIELMLSIKDRYIHLYYHKDTGVFDNYPVSAIELKQGGEKWIEFLGCWNSAF